MQSQQNILNNVNNKISILNNKLINIPNVSFKPKRRQATLDKPHGTNKIMNFVKKLRVKSKSPHLKEDFIKTVKYKNEVLNFGTIIKKDKYRIPIKHKVSLKICTNKKVNKDLEEFIIQRNAE